MLKQYDDYNIFYDFLVVFMSDIKTFTNKKTFFGFTI